MDILNGIFNTAFHNGKSVLIEYVVVEKKLEKLLLYLNLSYKLAFIVKMPLRYL